MDFCEHYRGALNSDFLNVAESMILKKAVETHHVSDMTKSRYFLWILPFTHRERDRHEWH